MDSMMSDMSEGSDHPCNEMLFKAVLKNNVEEVEHLLQHPDLNINYDIDDGSTILFASLYTTNESIFMSLLDAGFDINFRNNLQETPLHTAVVFSPISFVHELIKRGVDLNAREQLRYTPLNNAAFHGMLDAVCMLLYYGADVNVVGEDDMTPLMWALENDHVEVSKILFSFYDDFSCTNVDGDTTLHHAAMNANPLAIDIFRASTNQNGGGDSLLRFSLEYKSPEFFKLIWSRYKEEICVDDVALLDYLSICCFSNSDWLECLHLLFTAPVIFEHLLVCKCNCVFGMNENNVMSKLLCCLYKRKVDLPNRMALIYLCLSFGVKISSDDVNLAYLLYGFDGELEAFIYTFNYEQSIVPNNFLPLPRIIFALEDDYQIETVLPVFHYLGNTAIKETPEGIAQDVIFKSIGYCSLSLLQKRSIEGLWKICFQGDIDKRLAAIPEVPSLLELSRNQIREFTKQSCSINKSYQFHTIVRELNLPPYIKDIICFKTPVY